MTKIEQDIEDFFLENPDIMEARNKGVINRSALAAYIIKTKKIAIEKTDALITALRRYEQKSAKDTDLSIFKKITIATKDNISIIHLKKSDDVTKKLGIFISNIDSGKNETLKIVQGMHTTKVFVDSENEKEIEKFFQKNTEKVCNNISEINLIFPKEAIETKGIVSKITSHFFFNDINIIEFLSSTPELMIYVDAKDMIKAYSTLNRLKE